jgi:RNA polymerase sigma-70 factor (ECF subfamily)
MRSSSLYDRHSEDILAGDSSSTASDRLERASTGEPAALAELFDTHASNVYRVAYAILLSADDADDVVQDVFIGLPEALQHYKEQGTFSAWLRIVTARTALMRRRKMQRQAKPLAESPQHPDPSSALVERLTLERALAALPIDLRTVFVLKAIEGYSHEEISRRLGIRRGTAEVRLFRAIRRLRDLLKTV